MERKNIKDEILEQIAFDNFQNAITILVPLCKETSKELYWDAIVMSMKYYSIERSFLLGFLEHDSHMKLKTTLAFALLAITDKIILPSVSEMEALNLT